MPVAPQVPSPEPRKRLARVAEPAEIPSGFDVRCSMFDVRCSVGRTLREDPYGQPSALRSPMNFPGCSRALRFGPPVSHVYNPLVYARAPHAAYLARYGGGPKEFVLVGMNPGPWGMVQTGVPFGEVAAVRDWLGINGAGGTAGGPPPQAAGPGVRLPPQRGERTAPVGLDPRPLGHAGGVLPAGLRGQLLPAGLLRRRRPQPDPRQAAGGGPGGAAGRLRSGRSAGPWSCSAPGGSWAWAISPRAGRGRRWTACRVSIGRIPHPSPASPLANRGWEPAADAALTACLGRRPVTGDGWTGDRGLPEP